MFLIRNHPFIRDLLDTLEKQARLAPLAATMVSALPPLHTSSHVIYLTLQHQKTQGVHLSQQGLQHEGGAMI